MSDSVRFWGRVGVAAAGFALGAYGLLAVENIVAEAPSVRRAPLNPVVVMMHSRMYSAEYVPLRVAYALLLVLVGGLSAKMSLMLLGIYTESRN